jgi:hypothetical protein
MVSPKSKVRTLNARSRQAARAMIGWTIQQSARERAAYEHLRRAEVPEHAPVSCESCSLKPAVDHSLCFECLHAVECHAATLETAVDVECDGQCGRHRNHIR